jgi:glycosyltransferase involved in cell wall biosynthesis
MAQPWDDVEQTGEWLLGLAERTQPDVIHLNEPVFGSLDWDAPTLVVVHSCVLSWWENVWRTPAPPEWGHYRQEMAAGIQAADEVVTPSGWMLEVVRRLYGLKDGRVIPNGRSGEKLVPGAKAPLIFAAGRIWDVAKNLTALDHAAQDLPWPVYLAGDTEMPEGGNTVSLEHCRVLGRLPADSVASWLRRSSIYAFPAKYEPFGLSVLEAALAGCALVLSDLPTLRELWEGSAVFVAPEDHSTLHRVLQSLIEDQDLRNALATRARRRAQRLTPRRMAQAYLEAYRELLVPDRKAREDTACAS